VVSLIPRNFTCRERAFNLQLVAIHRRRLRRAIHELTESLAERRTQLDPGTVAKVEASLRVIDLAIDEAQRALAADPADPTLRDLLAGNYERQVELLRRASALLPST
jgi:hypothetical protein